MCFSAPSSFAAGALLCAIGTVSLRSARRPSENLFAVIPLLFAVQQICEGILWLVVADEQHAALRTSTTYLFLTFALVIWPVWIPLSVRAVETDPRRHRAISFFLLCGVPASLYFLFSLLTMDATAVVEHRHIRYDIGTPGSLIDLANLLYLVATLVPLFISTARRMWMFGAALITSYAAAMIFFNEQVISVWCALAAIESAVVVYILRSKDGSDSIIPADTAETRLVGDGA